MISIIMHNSAGVLVACADAQILKPPKLLPSRFPAHERSEVGGTSNCSSKAIDEFRSSEIYARKFLLLLNIFIPG
jgi:hypothetical protein